MQWLAFWVDTRVHGWRPRPEAPMAVHPVSGYGRTREDLWQALQVAATKLRSLASSVGPRDTDAFLSRLGQHVLAKTGSASSRRSLFCFYHRRIVRFLGPSVPETGIRVFPKVHISGFWRLNYNTAINQL
jgi:hypothetical protein